MSVRHERELRHLIDRVENGGGTAHEVTDWAVRHSFIAVGTAAYTEVHVPMPAPTTYVDEQHVYSKEWRYKIQQGEGAPAVVRGSRVARTALWAAFAGDLNVPRQRFLMPGLSFLDEQQQYLYGTNGWRYDDAAGNYRTHIHEDLRTAALQRDTSDHIGEISFMHDDGSFLIGVPDEPGHMASLYPHYGIASVGVRMGEVIPDILAATGYYYRPEPIR